MKKLTVFASLGFLFLCLTAGGCSSKAVVLPSATPFSEPEATIASPPPQHQAAEANPSMVGTWLLIRNDARYNQNADYRREAYNSCDDRYQFWSDGRFTETGHFLTFKVDASGTYRLNGDKLYLHYEKDLWGGQSYGRADGVVTIEVRNGQKCFATGLPTYIKGATWDNGKAQYLFENGVYADGPLDMTTPAPPSKWELLERRIKQKLKAWFGDHPPFSVDSWGENSYRLNIFGHNFETTKAQAIKWLTDNGFYKPGGQLFYMNYTDSLSREQQINKRLETLDKKIFFITYEKEVFEVGVLKGPYDKGRQLAMDWLKQQGFLRSTDSIKFIDFTHTENGEGG